MTFSFIWRQINLQNLLWRQLVTEIKEYLSKKHEKK
jgi:hypothetical protein